VILHEKAQAVHDELARLAQQMPAVLYLLSVPGVGVLTATALIAFVGDIRRFRSGRDFAAYIGLEPITSLAAPRPSASDWHPARDVPSWPGVEYSTCGPEIRLQSTASSPTHLCNPGEESRYAC